MTPSVQSRYSLLKLQHNVQPRERQGQKRKAHRADKRITWFGRDRLKGRSFHFSGPPEDLKRMARPAINDYVRESAKPLFAREAPSTDRRSRMQTRAAIRRIATRAGRLAWYRVGLGEFPQDETEVEIPQAGNGNGNGHGWGHWKQPSSWWNWRSNHGNGNGWGWGWGMLGNWFKNWGQWWADQNGTPDTAVVFETVKAEGYLYDEAGRRSGTVDQSGRITAYEYDTMGRLAEVAYARRSGKAQADWQERIDLGLTTGEPANEPSTSWMSLSNSQRTGLEELFDVVKEDQGENLNTWDRFWTEQFAYDNRGNRASKTNPWGTVGYDYDANNRMILAGNRTYGYDANGNLASENNGIEQVTYTYNHSNRMESMTRTVDGAQTASSEYAYDALGRRSRKAGGNAYEGYLYDGMGFQTAGVYALDRAAEEQLSALQKELRGPSVLAPSDNFRNGFWGNNRNLDEGARVLEEHQWVNGGIYAVRGRGNPIVSFQHRDALGSIVYTTREHGQIGKNIAYDAFGVPIRGMDLIDDDLDQDWEDFEDEWWRPYTAQAELSVGNTDDIDERFGYNGKALDQMTGTYDYGYRHYAPQVGRFTSVDPIKDGSNWYAYVGNDPVNFTDPLGLEASDNVWSGFAGAGNPYEGIAPDVSDEIRNAVMFSSLSKNNQNKINQLHPEIRVSATSMMYNLQDDGVHVEIYSGYRSNAQQNDLYALNRDEGGNVVEGKQPVTNAKGGESYHNYGLAFDVEVYTSMDGWKKDWNIEGENWAKVVEEGTSQGFESGSTWNDPKDWPHFQKTFGKSTSELSDMSNQGDVTGGFVNVQ